MISTIARQEFKNMLREGRFQTAGFLLFVLFCFSLYGAFDYHWQIENQHRAAAKTMREQWDNQKDKNPHGAAHYGTYVFKPVYPLAYFDKGIDAFTGNTLFLEGHRSNMAQGRIADEQGDFARLGVLTPAFVLGILMPLFIIILGFGLAAAERENGNLRLLLAQGVSPARLLAGKALALWYVTLLMAFPFFAIGALGGLLAGHEPEFWMRYGYLALFYLLYFGCFIHFTLLISAWTGRQNAALVASIGVWIWICLIVPKAAVNFADQWYPTPTWQSYHESIKNDLKNGVDGHDASDVFTKKLEAETLQKYGVDSVQQLPFNWDGFVMQKGEEHETYVFQKHQKSLLQVYRQQQTVYETAGFLSPYILANLASQQLSGTDIHVYFDFLAAAEKYRVKLVGELNNDLTQNFKYGDWEGKRGKDFFSKNAAFEYQPPALRQLSEQLRIPFLALSAWLLLSAWPALWFFKRLKPV